MLRPAAVTSLLSQLIQTDSGASETDLAPSSRRPHTALLTLLESSELYAHATRLDQADQLQIDHLAQLRSGSVLRQHPRSTSVPLSLDERAACLSAVAVTAWRNATSSAEKIADGSMVVGPGMQVSVSKHHVGPPVGRSGKEDHSQDLVPLLLECELGRVLVMPIVPLQLQTTPSRAEPTGGEKDEGALVGGSISHLPESQRAFMLLTLNSWTSAIPIMANTAPSTLANRSRFRSGGTTPTSMVSEATATPSRSPATGHAPSGIDVQDTSRPGATPTESSTSSRGETTSVDSLYAGSEEEEASWAIMYAQAKAFARHLAPSLAKCGVGAGGMNDEDPGEGRRGSHGMSEDEHDD